ncbi:MEDS domain-containing protein [Alicyclobacillus sacchari]|uniref:MEDS domain-containing protein n=1 Tax=Alicyclobacillus sacchari TaxID=392010 RepID=UPI001FBBEF0C|nr:MEDS domain-containing protein [Alicyclobacillus sacchari]
MQSTIALTHHVQVENGAHVLYFYMNQDVYIANAIAFIETAMEQQQHVILIESSSLWSAISQAWQQRHGDMPTSICYVDNGGFYGMTGDFRPDHVHRRLNQAVDPYITQARPVRLWGHVQWTDEVDIEEKLYRYETSCDFTVSELGFLTVCAYDAHQVPASVQIEMMRTHPYLMTDRELIRSNLYEHAGEKQYIYPSLSAQAKLESEMDLYKQKLDFVHVVSHEVRNPLTVIQAYATMLSADEPDPERAKKLRTIVDYTVVIDHEISHIMTTEQMLAAESIWHKRMLQPRSVLDEVLHIMGTKARTQNIALVADVDVAQTVTCLGNRLGYKLIFSNVISNAIKYSDEGSMVEVSCHVADQILHFAVIDHGVGMTEQQVARLFRKYEKQNEEESGHGIGLFMVKKLVDEFGGDICVQSELGVGTRVVIQLPVV